MNKHRGSSFEEYVNKLVQDEDYRRWIFDYVSKLEEALEFYADDSNWIEASGDKIFDQFVSYDLGKRAREALDD